MATGTFLGTTASTYTQYLSMGSGGHTLVALPGVTYNVAIADQWQGLAMLPGDGQWVPSVQRTAAFSAVPGLAIPGGGAPGEPGISHSSSALVPLRAAARALPAATAPAERGPRVITGQRRKLRPGVHRRVLPRHRTVTVSGARSGH